MALIKQMARDNRLWGAERIRGALLTLGIHVCKRTMQKHMQAVRTTRPPGQTWKTFLHTHAQQIWCTGYLVHPFKNKPFETEKEILSLLANTGGSV